MDKVSWSNFVRLSWFSISGLHKFLEPLYVLLRLPGSDINDATFAPSTTFSSVVTICWCGDLARPRCLLLRIRLSFRDARTAAVMNSDFARKRISLPTMADQRFKEDRLQRHLLFIFQNIFIIRYRWHYSVVKLEQSAQNLLFFPQKDKPSTEQFVHPCSQVEAPTNQWATISWTL